jgi:hypothetical protein
MQQQPASEQRQSKQPQSGHIQTKKGRHEQPRHDGPQPDYHSLFERETDRHRNWRKAQERIFHKKQKLDAEKKAANTETAPAPAPAPASTSGRPTREVRRAQKELEKEAKSALAKETASALAKKTASALAKEIASALAKEAASAPAKSSELAAVDNIEPVPATRPQFRTASTFKPFKAPTFKPVAIPSDPLSTVPPQPTERNQHRAVIQSAGQRSSTASGVQVPASAMRVTQPPFSNRPRAAVVVQPATAVMDEIDQLETYVYRPLSLGPDPDQPSAPATRKRKTATGSDALQFGTDKLPAGPPRVDAVQWMGDIALPQDYEQPDHDGAARSVKRTRLIGSSVPSQLSRVVDSDSKSAHNRDVKLESDEELSPDF